MSIFRTNSLWCLLNFFIVLVILPAATPVFAATSQELIEALGIATQVTSHSLISATRTSSGSCQTADDNALADTAEKSVLISNGLAHDVGLGDTDLICSDDSGAGFPDYTQFQMALDVPTEARSLVFRTQFITDEYVSQSTDVRDEAFLFVSLSSGSHYTVDISKVSSVTSKTSPGILRSIDVDEVENIELSFRIQDNVDGSADAAVKIMDFHFSEEATSGEFAEYLPEDVKLPSGTYRYSKTMLRVPGKGIPLDFTIHYNSRNSRTRYFYRKWTHSYEWSIHRMEEDEKLLLLTGDGGAVYFCKTDDDAIYAECNDASNTSFENAREGSSSTVVINDDGTYTYTSREQMIYAFSSGGLLNSIGDTHGNRLALFYKYYQNTSSYCQGIGRNYLDYIKDTRGGRLQFYYSSDPTNYCYRMLVSMEYSADNVTLHFLSTTYQLVPDCYNHDVLDLTYVNASEGQTLFSYDCSGNMLTATDPDGVVFRTNTYAGERVATAADGKGSVESYTYLEDNIEHTDRLGLVDHKYFDIQDRLIRQTDPAGNSWRYTHDASGNVISQTDPLGNLTTMTYDQRGNLLSITDALGNTSSMTFDTHNNIESATDPAGHSTTYTYQEDTYNLLQETDPNGHTVSYTYDDAGQIETMTDRMGNTFQYKYADGGDLLEETDPLGNTLTYVHDNLGHMTAMTKQRGDTTTYTYDGADNLLELTLPDNATIQYTYDAQGRMLSMEKANGALTSYQYSETGKLIHYEDPLGNIFRSGYDAEDQLVSQTDPLGKITAFAYDSAGRMIAVTDAAGGHVNASYDAAGNRTSLTDPNRNTTWYAYDPLGRITLETDALGNTFENIYNARGQLEGFHNGRGDHVTFHYDPAGRLDQTGFPGYTIRKMLDANGNDIETEGKDNHTIQRVYNALDRMINRTDSFGNTIGYAYDASGNLSALTYSDGKTVQYAYNERNRLESVTDWDGNITTYTYDMVGNLTATTLPDGSQVTYIYDIAGQLISISDASQGGTAIFAADFQYNGAGLRTSAEYHTLPLKPEISEKEASFAYNAANQLTRMNGQVFSYDLDGNMTTGVIGDVSKNMEYDELNRLTRVGQDVYTYDPEGLRVQATTGGRAVRYVQDPNAPHARVLEEHDDQGNILARYVYGVGLISRQDSGGGVSVYHYDSRGSTIALTDPSGNITDRYAYDPYGRRAGRQGITENPFTYNGRDGVVDDGNGLYFMRARYYEPQLMRFIQKDAVSGNMINTQSLNRYAYVMGNPIQFVDPGGKILPIILAAGAGVATEIALDWATGEFNPLEDNWGTYLENNWVDLSVAAVLGSAGKAFQLAKELKYVKKFEVMRHLKAGGIAGWKLLPTLGRQIKNLARVEKLIKGIDRALDAIQALGWEDDVNDATENAWNWTRTAAKDTANWVDTAAEDTVEWVEDAGNTIADAGTAVYNWARSLW